MASKNPSEKPVGSSRESWGRDLSSMASTAMRADDATKMSQGMDATLAGWMSGLSLKEICQLSMMVFWLYLMNMPMFSEYQWHTKRWSARSLSLIGYPELVKSA